MAPRLLVPRLCLGTHCLRGSASPPSPRAGIVSLCRWQRGWGYGVGCWSRGRASQAARSQAEPGNEGRRLLAIVISRPIPYNLAVLSHPLREGVANMCRRTGCLLIALAYVFLP